MILTEDLIKNFSMGHSACLQIIMWIELINFNLKYNNYLLLKMYYHIVMKAVSFDFFMLYSASCWVCA